MRASITPLVILIFVASCGFKNRLNDSFRQGQNQSDNASSPDDFFGRGIPEHSDISGEEEMPKVADEKVPEVINEKDISFEPVAIGGAFLTCSHQNPQIQNKTAAWVLNCNLNSVEAKNAKVTASFAKLDLKGMPMPLTVLAQNTSAGLSWQISDGPNTMFMNKIELSVGFNNAPPATFAALAETPFSLVLNKDHWLTTEPNNVQGNEDCVAFVNEAERVDHAARNGVVHSTFARFNVQDCNARKRFLCRRIDSSLAAKWALSDDDERFIDAAINCPLGYKFSFPMSDAEIIEASSLVDALAGRAEVWVALSDLRQEGTFDVILK